MLGARSEARTCARASLSRTAVRRDAESLGLGAGDEL